MTVLASVASSGGICSGPGVDCPIGARPLDDELSEISAALRLLNRYLLADLIEFAQVAANAAASPVAFALCHQGKVAAERKGSRSGGRLHPPSPGERPTSEKKGQSRTWLECPTRQDASNRPPG